MKKLFVCLIALLVACSTVSFAEQPTITDEMIVATSITTGLPTDKAPQIMVAQMDNEPGARPQMGIGSADIVYEVEVYNGGYTRYTAVFNDTIPELIEAVRSARIVNADLYLEYGGCFVHFGGQQYEGSSVYDYFTTINMQARYDGLSDSTNFYRDNSRSAPNNVVSRFQQIYNDIDWSGVTCTSPLSFSADAYTVKGEPCTAFSVKYRDGYHPGYTYNAEDGLYYRTYNDVAHNDGITGEQLTCANVIVHYAGYSWYDGASDRPNVALTGTNRCEYFIDGMRFTGYWVRDAVSSSTTYYDDEGNVVQFKPGKTFIQILDDAEEVTIAE